jgi:hypothetical protein
MVALKPATALSTVVTHGVRAAAAASSVGGQAGARGWSRELPRTIRRPRPGRPIAPSRSGLAPEYLDRAAG